MDWHIGILLIAIVFTYLAWRRARRENELARARSVALEAPRWMYRLEPLAGETEIGYRVAAADSTWTDDEVADWERHGIDIIDIDGDNVRADSIVEDAFEAGAGIRLVVDDESTGDNRLVSAWDDSLTIHLGWVPHGRAAEVSARLAAGDLSDCVVLRELLTRGTRTGVQLLLVHRDTAVDA
jgi:hypothetical protein